MSDSTYREPCRWAAKPPERWECLTHDGIAEDPLDLGRPCQKRMDLALAEIDRLQRHPFAVVKNAGDLSEVEYASLDGNELTVEDFMHGFQRLGISFVRTGEPDAATKAMLKRVEATLR